jgi:hypothetical protein
MFIPANDQPATASDLLDHGLWRLDFTDGNFCVAQAEEQTYIVLFTSPERAQEFLEGGAPEDPAGANAVLFSDGAAQFQRAAVLAFEEGLDGALIDPDLNGEVALIVDFAVPEPDDAA